MKKVYLFILISLIGIGAHAQSFAGLLTDNYSGVLSVVNNPANIADSPYKLDINLGGLSAYIGNDYFGFRALDIINQGFILERDASRFPKEENNLLSNVDVLGPSVLLNISKKSSIALFSRARFFNNVNSVDGNELQKLEEGFDTNTDFFVRENEASVNTNAWAEIGLTFANVLVNKEKHFVKGGVSFKYLRGLGNAYSSVNDLAINYEAETVAPGAENTGAVTTTGNVNFGSSANFTESVTNYEAVEGASAVAFDLGLVYEYRPEKLAYLRNNPGMSKYKLKVGLSFTDIGSIVYEGIDETYDIETSVSQNDFENISSPNEIRDLYPRQLTSQLRKASLPAAVHAFVDWNFNQRMYVNFTGDVSLSDSDLTNRSRIANSFRVTPRYERKWLSILMPMSIQQYSGIEVGGGLRLGPLYAGSASFFTALLKKETKAADAYLGVRLPLYKPRLKDTDQDGIPDKIDTCVDVPGDPENDGCPWEDADDDGVPDNDDECPDIPGTEKNNGCPKVTTKVRRTINSYAKTILFESNESTIKTISNEALQEIIDIIKKYPDAQFVVEGHTDSTGGSLLNEKLSYSRAHAVMNYLIDNGISRNRLSSRGFGEDKPVASNATAKGRAKNRRVEINLIKSN